MIKNSVSLFYCKSKSVSDAGLHLGGEFEYKILKDQMQKPKACGCRYASSRQDEYKRKVLKDQDRTHKVRLAKEMNTVTKERLMQVCI